MTSARAGQPYTYQAAAEDPDGSSLAFLLYDAPAGMSVDSESGLLTWSPTASDPAELPVNLRVYDSRGGFVAQEFTISVDGGNESPVFAPMPEEVTGQEGVPLEVLAAASDPDGDPLTVQVHGLPPGASFDPHRRRLSWIPSFTAAGTYPDVTFTASDGVNQVSHSMTLLVQPANRPPELIQPADQTVREGDPLRVELAADDEPGSVLRFSSRLLPGGAALNPTTGVLEWTPQYFQAGTYEIPLTVSDGEASDTESMTVTVLNVNAAPEFRGGGARRVSEGETLRVRPFAFDPDNPTFVPRTRLADGSLTPREGAPATVTYASAELPAGATFDDEAITLEWTPGFDQAGEYLVSFTAEDGGDGTGTPRSTSLEVPITVVDTNRPPQIAPIPAETVSRGEVLEVPVDVTDPDGDSLTLTATGATGFDLPEFASFTDNGDGTGLLQVEPGLGDKGTYELTIRAQDDGGVPGESSDQEESLTFAVTVQSPNEPPILGHIGDKVAVLGDTLEFTVRASDLDEDPLTFEAVSGPDELSIVEGAAYGTAVVQWTPTAGDEGTYAVTMRVSDSGNGDPTQVMSDEASFELVVRQDNQAPVLPPVGDRQVTETDTLTISLEAVDPDGDSLTYSAANLPAGAQLDPETGVFTWTPSVAQAGSYSDLRLAVSDGHRSSSETMEITVQDKNQAPVLAPLFPQFGRENAALQFRVAASDADQDILSYSAVTPLPDGAQLNPFSGRFEWTPGFEQAGSYTIEVQAEDSAGLADTAEVRLEIANVNRAPSLDVSHHTAVLGQPLEFTLRGSDPDAGSELTYSAVGLPEGATLDSATGRFTWTPVPGQEGVYPVRVEVSDGEATASRSVLIRATITPPAPDVLIELTPSFPAEPGDEVLVHAIASSLANITDLSVSVEGESLELDDRGRARFVAPSPGGFLVEATAVDADGLSGTTQRAIKVRDPADRAAPEVSFAPGLALARLSEPTDVLGTVEDLNLDSWRLEIEPLRGGAARRLATGTDTAAAQSLTTIDPSTLRNGFYRLRLSARDISGRTSTIETRIEIASSSKSAQYQRNEADLSTTLGGVPVMVTRSYDSLARHRTGTFGPGWRLAERDVQLETDVPSSGREHLGVFEPYRVGTRLYLTLPGGQRVGYTFTPERHEIPGLTYYSPRWTPDSGVEYQLASAETLLTLAGNRLHDLHSGQPYNPASDQFDGPQFTLTAPDGIEYQISAEHGVERQVAPGGAELVHSDAGIVASNGEAIEFHRDSQDRLTSIVGPDGTRLTYSYDAAGNLTAVRNFAEGKGNRYGYTGDDPHVLTLVSTSDGESEVVRYGEEVRTEPIVGRLGSARQFNGRVSEGNLDSGATDHYTFAIRRSELEATERTAVLVGVLVEAADGGSLEPDLPVIEGHARVGSHSESGRAFALYAVDEAGLQLLSARGADAVTSGGYRVQLFIAGDVNADGVVDGVDAELQQSAVGSRRGESSYLAGADADRDGGIDAADVQILAGNFGFAVNRPPVLSANEVLTHEDLEVTVPLDDLATDPENDPLFFSIESTTSGTANLTGDGSAVRFTPAPGFAGTAGFELLADDGFSRSAPTEITIEVSDAPLLSIDFVQRQPRLDAGRAETVALVGNFADQQNVSLPASYVELRSLDPAIATVSSGGRLRGIADGSTILHASHDGIQAATAVSVGFPEDFIQQMLFVAGIDVFPGSVSLPPDGTRQIIADLNDQVELSSAEEGTRYFSGNENVAMVEADGLISAMEKGTTTVTVINGVAEATLTVKVTDVQTGEVEVGAEGAVVGSEDGLIAKIAPGALSEPETVTIQSTDESSLPFAVPNGLQFGGAFELDLGEGTLQEPAQLALPVGDRLSVGDRVLFYRAGTILNEAGEQEPLWYQVDVGVVDEHGTARTTSPPHQGFRESGTYAFGSAPATGEVRGNVQAASGINDGGSSFAAVSNLGGGVGVGAAFDLLKGFVLTLLGGRQQVELVELPQVGLPNRLFGEEVDVVPGKVNAFETVIPVTPPDDASPFVESLKVEVSDSGPPELLIQGGGFGGEEDQLFVDFIAGPRDAAQARIGAKDVRVEVDWNVQDSEPDDGELRIPVPSDVAVGAVQIVLRKQLSGTGETFSSTSERLVTPGSYVFTTMSRTSQLAVFDARSQVVQDEELIDNPNFNELVAKIDLDGASSANDVAVTSDNTRAYVTFSRSGSIAVIDTQSLREIDALADEDILPNDSEQQKQRKKKTLGFNRIELPVGARPFQIVIDPNDHSAYVSDRSPYNPIYRVDIDPSSDSYHQVETIPVSPTPEGLRGLDLDASGDFLYAAAPTKTTPDDPASGPGHLLVVDLRPGSKTYYREIGLVFKNVDAIQVEPGIYGVRASSQPGVVGFTSYVSPDARGFGRIEYGSQGLKSGPTYTSINLGYTFDTFDVDDPREVVYSPGDAFAFVAGYAYPDLDIPSSNHFNDRDVYGIRNKYPAGSTIGVIQDPFGPNHKLVAATRPIPTGFPHDLSMSPDGYLYVTYPVLQVEDAGKGAVFVYDAKEIIEEIQKQEKKGAEPVPRHQEEATLLERVAVNDVKDGQVVDGNVLIDEHAAYRQDIGFSGLFPKFEVYDDDHAPLGIGGTPRGLVAQDDFLRLVGPLGTSDSRAPEFEWEIIGARGVESTLYASVFPPGEGLFPEDTPEGIDPQFTEGGDFNPNRILSGIDLATGVFEYQLPDVRELTAGQRYYWGVEAVADDGRVSRKSGSFRVSPVDLHSPFNGVTVVTHGFQLDLFADDDPIEHTPQHFVELATRIAEAGGGGTVLLYNRQTGQWQTPEHESAAEAVQRGKPLVLVPDWVKESDITDSGFAEAAADAIFASLVQLDRELTEEISDPAEFPTGDLLSSPLHFIGHSRGTSVNSEIIQRLGRYYPDIDDVHMTTLDPHEFKQDSLDVPVKTILDVLQTVTDFASKVPLPLVRVPAMLLNNVIDVGTSIAGHLGVGIDPVAYADFLDPDVQRWENVEFVDNYYQTQAKDDGLGFTFTPNGRSLPDADLNVALDGRSGFTQDDLLVPNFGWGGPHSRVWRWYAGTSNVNGGRFEPSETGEPLFRRLGDGSQEEVIRKLLTGLPTLFVNPFAAFGQLYDLSQYTPFEDFNLESPNPWYTAKEHAGHNATLYADPQGVWEGIGEGWFYSALGGGADDRPDVLPIEDRTEISSDNTEPVALQELNDEAVPSFFNGHFELGTMHKGGFKSNRFPFSYEVPGWSFHGGKGFDFTHNGSRVDFTSALVFQLDIETIAKGFVTDTIEAFVDETVGEVQELINKRTTADFPKKWREPVGTVVDYITSNLPFINPGNIKGDIKDHLNRLWPTQTDHALLLGGRSALHSIFDTVANSNYSGDVANFFADAGQAILDNLVNVDTVRHNRMLIPDYDQLAFDVLAPVMVSPNSKIRVSINTDLDAPNAKGQEIDTVRLRPSFFETNRYYVDIPEELRGKVGTVTFEMISIEESLEEDSALKELGIQGLLSSIFFIDNIQFETLTEEMSADGEAIEKSNIATVTGSLKEPQQETTPFAVDWSNGSGLEEVGVNEGDTEFAASITVGEKTGSDGRDARGVSNPFLAVRNVEPELDIHKLSLTVAEQDGLVTADISTSGRAHDDASRVWVDWGDGGVSLADLDPESNTLTAAHRYVNEAEFAQEHAISLVIENADDGTVDREQATIITVKPTVLSPGTAVYGGPARMPALTPALLKGVVEAARERWMRTLEDERRQAVLQEASFEILDLPGAQLGSTVANPDGSHEVRIDRDAAAIGWFVDQTPLLDEEFLAADASGLFAEPESLAAGAVDLLTVVAHEIGHVLGLRDLNDPQMPLSVMTAMLRPGVRRVPSADDVDAKLNDSMSSLDEAATSRSTTTFTMQLDTPRQVVNGLFAIGGPGEAVAGWHQRGGAEMVNGEGVLTERGRVLPQFKQTFAVPEEATGLSFTIVSPDLGTDLSAPPDAFEAALLHAETGESLVETAAGLTMTDAFLNLQAAGEVYFGAEVENSAASSSGDMAPLDEPIDVTVDLSSVPAGTTATLYFDLLGFGAENSSVRIDDVRLLGAETPELALKLHADSDSGVAGDQITNISPATFVGTTDPQQEVRLDTDGDGFDDGSTTADQAGGFRFENVVLAEGTNSVRVQATNAAGATTRELTATLDTQPPGGSLASPAAGSTLISDPGSVQVQWSDSGAAGIDADTFGIDDVSIPGVSIDQIERLGGGAVRYLYGQDGDQLSGGTIEVTTVSGEVADLAGNANAAETFSFVFQEPSVDVPPVVDLNGPEAGIDHAATFVEDGDPVSVAAAEMTVVDEDSSRLSSATVTLTNPKDGDDELLAVDPQGTSITTGYDPSSGVLSLAGSDAVANYQQVLRTLVYEDKSQDPDPTPRTIEVVVSDGDLESEVAVSTIQVVPVDDPPILDLNGPAAGRGFVATFTEGFGAVSISSSAVNITDVDSSQLTSATATITNLQDGAAESLLADTDNTPISAGYEETQGVLTLTGPASLESYAEVLGSLRYHNALRVPDPRARRVEVVVSDGTSASEPATASVEVIPSNHSISGYVYVDVNNNGIKEEPELALPNVPITLEGPVTRKTLTASDGSYRFRDLPHGTYSVTETQPSAFMDGQETPGEPVDVDVENNAFQELELTSGNTSAVGYNFGERGLRAELVTKRLFLSSTPTGDELLRELELIGGERWFAFAAEHDGTVAVEMGSGAADPAIEIYRDGWAPVTLSAGESAVTAEVQERTSYAVYVSGDGLETANVAVQPDRSGIYTNPGKALDVSGDGFVSPIDALFVIQELNDRGSHMMTGPGSDPPYLDVSGDGYVSPVDALHVIGYLNDPSQRVPEAVSAEGEAQQRMAAAPSEPRTATFADRFFLSSQTRHGTEPVYPSGISFTHADSAEGEGGEAAVTAQRSRRATTDQPVTSSETGAAEAWLAMGLDEMAARQGASEARDGRRDEEPLSNADSADQVFTDVALGVAESRPAELPRAAWHFGDHASAAQRRALTDVKPEAKEESLSPAIDSLLTELAADVAHSNAWNSRFDR